MKKFQQKKLEVVEAMQYTGLDSVAGIIEWAKSKDSTLYIRGDDMFMVVEVHPDLYPDRVVKGEWITYGPRGFDTVVDIYNDYDEIEGEN